MRNLCKEPAQWAPLTCLCVLHRQLLALPALCRGEISLAVVKEAARWGCHPACLSSTSTLLFVTIVRRKLSAAKVFTTLWTMANEPNLALV